MELAVEISQIIHVGDLIIENADFLEVDTLVKGNLSLSCFDHEACVPSSSVRSAESATQWMGKGKRSIDNSRVGNTGDQFLNPNAGQEIVLRPDLLVG